GKIMRQQDLRHNAQVLAGVPSVPQSRIAWPRPVDRPVHTPRTTIMKDLLPLAETIAARLKARKETIAIAESSTGGLISAALLPVGGASAYFMGGGVVYTRQAKQMLLSIDDAAIAQFRAATEGHALILARAARARFSVTWGLSETGATGPTGNRYGDPA